MSFTNSTPNYGLPQYIGTDKPTYLGDMNTAYSTIDTQMKANADAASAATSTANSAAATATAASTNATTALSTANSAASEAASATSAAASATSTANNAATDAANALRASAANTIENLAPAYDPTLTYNVGDLVTYIDENNSGKLYKCIVAVSSPEAFNINKWDDVTTSDVYEYATKSYTTPFSSGELVSLSWIDLFNYMINNHITNGHVYQRIGNDNLIYNIDEMLDTSDGVIKFSNVNCTSAGTLITSCIAYYFNTSTFINREYSVNSAGTVTYNNNDSETRNEDGSLVLYYN